MLPAINKQIDLFTTGKNVDKELVNQIEKLIKEIKKITVRNLPNTVRFNTYFSSRFYTKDLDTFMYLVSFYSFPTPHLESAYSGRNEIYFETTLHVPIKTEGIFADIHLKSGNTKLNLLPNDIKQVLNI